MYQFKEGDKVFAIVAGCKDCGAEFKKNESGVMIGTEVKIEVKTEEGWYCSHPENWQLVEPKEEPKCTYKYHLLDCGGNSKPCKDERTIEDVRVGDTVIDTVGTELTVQEVLEKCFAYTTQTCENLLWQIKGRAKQYGWKIKQPELEKKEANKSDIADDIMNHFLNKGAKVSREDYEYLLTKLI